MSLEWPYAGEFFGRNNDVEMAPAVPRSGVSDVFVAFVDYFKARGRKFSLDSLANLLHSEFVHGNTILKGLTADDL